MVKQNFQILYFSSIRRNLIDIGFSMVQTSKIHLTLYLMKVPSTLGSGHRFLTTS